MKLMSHPMKLWERVIEWRLRKFSRGKIWWKCVPQTFFISAENLVSCLCHQVIYFIFLSSHYISSEYLLVCEVYSRFWHQFGILTCLWGLLSCYLISFIIVGDYFDSLSIPSGSRKMTVVPIIYIVDVFG